MLNRKMFILLMIINSAVFTVPSAQSAQANQPHNIIPIEIRKDIKVVYQANRDEWKNDVGKPLAYVKKLTGVYDEYDIPPQEQHISVVFHGDAGYWMLTDDTYNIHTNTTSGNPNKEIIHELVKKGVSIELCAQTMKSKGWSANDILPKVKIVIGAYPRIIDLQLQGYAYIKF